DAGEAVVVGVNRFADDAPQPVELFQIDPAVEQQQAERVRAVRSSRSEAEWRAALDGVEQAARGGENLVPPIVRAVEARATLGEVADALRRVFGEYQPPE